MRNFLDYDLTTAVAMSVGVIIKERVIGKMRRHGVLLFSGLPIVELMASIYHTCVQTGK